MAIRPDDPGISANLGTSLQDCALICSTFERGAHSTPTEAAVFATFTRLLENSKSISDSVITSFSSYMNVPKDTAVEEVTQAVSAGGVQGGSGTSTPNTGATLQGLNLNDGGDGVSLGDSFGNALLDMAKNCIPCLDRLTTFLELHANVDLLGAFEADILARLSFLMSLGNMFNDLGIYGDFCELLNLLSFMCIPDLQALIAMLMALLILDIPKFDGLIGFLQGLILPIFAPIFTAITSLLDQFSLTVMSPLDCIIDAINQQLRKLNYELDPTSPLQDAKKGIAELNLMVVEAKQTVQDKLDLYIMNIKALFGEFAFTDAAYLELSIKKLKILRMVGFLVAIIKALSKGALACSSQGQPLEQSELDNFFDNFLNPSSPFDLWVDNNGAIHVDEKVPGQAEALSTFNNVFQFDGRDLVSRVEEVATALVKPATIVVPCKLSTTSDDADKINLWISELNAS